VFLSALMLAACGGGGGDSSPTPATTSKTWGTASLIETENAGAAYASQIAIDAGGNALAVWYQHDGTRYNIWANRYTAGTGWGAATLIETDDAGGAQLPQIAIDADGNALAVWAQHDGTRNNIWANRYTTGAGWGTASLIETDNSGSAFSPQIAIDASGNALAVWGQDDGTENSIFANRYTASNNAWGSAVVIETDNEIGHSANDPQIALDASGNAIAVWQQSDGTRTNVWANRYSVGTGWGTGTLIETDDAGNAYSPQIAMDANGNALAVWSQFDGAHNNIVANRYVHGTGWGTASPIETSAALNAGTPRIAFDLQGNALAVWVQDGATAFYDVWANRYTPGSGWGTAALIETDDAGSGGSPEVAFDVSGNALAVWMQSDGTRFNIVANRYTAGSGWGTANLIETDDAGSANEPQIAIDANGNALAVWYQSDGVRSNIWANRYQ
jgi:hypothetical protein